MLDYDDYGGDDGDEEGCENDKIIKNDLIPPPQFEENDESLIKTAVVNTDDVSVSSELYIDCKVEHEKTEFSDVNSSLLQIKVVEQGPNSLASVDEKSLNSSEVSTMTPDEAEKLLSTRLVKEN